MAEPGPRSLTDDELSKLLAAQRFGALATSGSGGPPRMSTVAYTWDPEHRVVRIATVADRPNARRLRRDPRCALYVASDDFWSFVVAEGEAELSPVSTQPGDEVGLELLAMQPPFADPADELTFLQQMAADRRMVVRLPVTRLYGAYLDMPSE